MLTGTRVFCCNQAADELLPDEGQAARGGLPFLDESADRSGDHVQQCNGLQCSHHALSSEGGHYFASLQTPSLQLQQISVYLRRKLRGGRITLASLSISVSLPACSNGQSHATMIHNLYQPALGSLQKLSGASNLSH